MNGGGGIEFGYGLTQLGGGGCGVRRAGGTGLYRKLMAGIVEAMKMFRKKPFILLSILVLRF